MDPELMAEWGRRGLQLATENMDKIVDLCREWQCKVTVVVYPWPDDVALGDRNSMQVTLAGLGGRPRRALHRRIRGLFPRAGR